jgi:hypothetical protein
MLRMMQNDLVSIFARDTTFHHVLLVGGKTDMCVDPDIPHRIAQCGGLDAAVAAAAHEAEPGGLSALLAAKAELAERRNPALKSARLRRQADWTATPPTISAAPPGCFAMAAPARIFTARSCIAGTRRKLARTDC